CNSRIASQSPAFATRRWYLFVARMIGRNITSRTSISMNTSGTPENVREEIAALLPRLRRFARNLTRNPDDADDVVQMALERALARLDKWRGGEVLGFE